VAMEHTGNIAYERIGDVANFEPLDLKIDGQGVVFLDCLGAMN
jgi:hypothetical protein